MMGPIAAVESVLFNCFNFGGRATRAEYWWFMLLYMIASFISLWLDIMQAIGADEPSINPLSYTVTWLSLLFFIPTLAVTIRRLHDSGRSGFWYLFAFVPVVGLIVLLMLMIAPSEMHDNIYGPVPRILGNDARGSQRSGTQKKDPMQAYALLHQIDEEPTTEMLEARRREISEYYKSRVVPEAGNKTTG